MNLNEFQIKTPKTLPAMAGLAASFHQFDQRQIDAITAAWYAGRPLLVRGDPGLGKSQLAHAIAAVQKWNLLVHVVHSRTEPDDLLYRVDHVARLAKAQLIHYKNPDEEQKNIELLDEKRFVVPGPLWWAYAPESAQQFFDDTDFNTSDVVDGNKPTVLLIDEIDKADSELPNSLLEVLNNQSFHAYGHDQPITADLSKRPFVVITSNEERQLPAAFLRRCVCLHLTMHKGDEGVAQLCAIADAHDGELENISDEVAKLAAQMVIDKRKQSMEGEYKPGTSEYLDLLRVLNSPLYQAKDKKDDSARLKALDEISEYILDK